MTDVRLDAYPPLCQRRLGGRMLAWIRGGRAAIHAGVLLLGAMLAGAVEWWSRDDSQLEVFAWLAGAGGVSVAVGLTQREWARRRYRAAVTVVAQDPGGASGGPVLAESAVHYCRQTSELTLAVEASLAGDVDTDWSTAQQILARTKCAIGLASRFKRDSVRVNLVPTMRLHIAFWLGAQIGRSPSKPIGVLQPMGTGDDTYFLAAVVARPSLRRPRRLQRLRWPWPALPLRMRPEELRPSERPRVALVLRTQQRPTAADTQARELCQAVEVDQILWFQLRSEELTNSSRGYTQVVNQIRRVWCEQLPSNSADDHIVVLDTTVTIAFALGAYLAGTKAGRWTAYTLDSHSGELVPFPPVRDRV